MATEDRWAAALALGESAPAVHELQALLEVHPLRERAAALLATALYREGRQGDALEVVRAIKERLVEELGIDPGPALVRLEGQLLAQDPALAAVPAPAPAVPAQRRPVDTALRPGRRVPRLRTSFIGRRAELDRLAALLDGAPLVTLTGPAGVGKTRLAVEAARARGDDDGPWVAELAGVLDAAALPAALAEATGLSDVTTSAELADALAARTALLVLDNCEHLVDAVAGLVDLLLERCPGLQVLATSREALDLPGEALLELRPLDPEGDALALLRERLGGTEADADVLRRLSRDLDGLPLALELAAAQCRVLSPAQVVDLLHDRFSVLRSGGRSGHAHHATLEDALAWSYDLLEPEQQQVFAALSVFRAPFDLTQAQAVTGGPAVLDAVRALVAKSLVSVVPDSSPRRYHLLESLRQFADARLPGDRREGLLRAHSAAVTALAEQAERRLRTADGPTWLRRLEEAMPDLRLALRDVGAADRGADRAEADLRLARAVSWFCYRRGHVAEGVRWLDAALTAAPHADPALRARSMISLAVVHYLTGDYTAGGALLGPAREAALLGGDPLAAADALSFSAYLRIFDGDLDAAERTALEALAEVEALAQEASRAEHLMLIGQVLRFGGRTQEALDMLDRAAAAGLAVGHTWVAGSSRWIACKVLSEAGEDVAAAERLPDLLRLWSEEGDVTSWLVAAMTLGGCLARLGRPEQGAVLLGAASAVGERLGFPLLEMVQFGGPDDVESVRTRLSPADYQHSLERGRADPAAVLAAAATGHHAQALQPQA